MIVTTNVSPEGTVTVLVDTDQSEGAHYSPEVLDDMISRAEISVMTLWTAIHLTPVSDTDPDPEPDDTEWDES